jgi:hypothetical protein
VGDIERGDDAVGESLVVLATASASAVESVGLTADIWRNIFDKPIPAQLSVDAGEELPLLLPLTLLPPSFVS